MLSDSNLCSIEGWRICALAELPANLIRRLQSLRNVTAWLIFRIWHSEVRTHY